MTKVNFLDNVKFYLSAMLAYRPQSPNTAIYILVKTQNEISSLIKLFNSYYKGKDEYNGIISYCEYLLNPQNPKPKWL